MHKTMSFLAEGKVGINDRDDDRRTALHWACAKVRTLTNSYLDPNLIPSSKICSSTSTQITPITPIIIF